MPGVITDYLDLALQHAERGYYVHPVRCKDEGEKKPTKSPYVHDWENAATRDPAQIQRWWDRWPDALVAVAPGRSKLAVVDLDAHVDRPSGLDTVELENLPAHADVERTSWSGTGKHLWYSGEDYSLNGVYDGIDRKSSGGYIVATYELPPVTEIREPLPKVYQGGTRIPGERLDTVDLRQWILDHGGKKSALVQDVLDRLPDPFVGHQLLIESVRTLVGYGARDYAGAGTALIELGRMWVAAEHASGDADDEYDKAVEGAIRKFGGETQIDISSLYGPDQDDDRGGEDPEQWEFKLPGSYTAADIEHKQFAPPAWVVPGMLPEGLTLLVANPKIGKSWMVLDIAASVAAGLPAVGTATASGKWDVLYMAFEDSERTIQTRMSALGTPFSKQLMIVNALPDKADGLEWIKAYYESRRGRPSVVIIDTLARMMPAETTGSVYRAEYDYVAQLKNMIPSGSALVLVHHLNKSKQDDFMLQVSGTQGISGAADTVITIKRPRFEDEATLETTSRFGHEVELSATFDNGKWTVASDDALGTTTDEEDDDPDTESNGAAGYTGIEL